ncbi:MAG TPA: hypothetical protein VER14_04680 [Phototrophicaceae bacterium]|nr:hypothetical protein [Phototrophicaceae bacterium]
MRFDCFGLIGSEDLAGFTNITKTMSANHDDEEIWIDMLSCKTSNTGRRLWQKYQATRNAKKFTEG